MQLRAADSDVLAPKQVQENHLVADKAGPNVVGQMRLGM
jgi:hypothetical protein